MHIKLLVAATAFASMLSNEYSVSTGSSFQLKLYWEDGTEWQESFKERKYCIQCDNECKEGEKLRIQNCNKHTSRQRFYYKNEKLQSKRNRDLCLTYGEHKDDVVYLRNCDDDKYNDRQRIGGFKYSGKFQLRPKDDEDKSSSDAFCITNQHHPKAGEHLQMVRCRTAEKNDSGVKDDTSHWVVGYFDA